MAITFKNIQDIILDKIDVDDATTLGYVKQFINMAGRDIWMAHPWFERYEEAEITTVAPYSTGTITATKGSTTVTGSGTSFPTTIVNYETKFARSISDPWYAIASRGSATSLTLETAYAETSTGAGASYVVYWDTYALSPTVDELVDVRLIKPNYDGSMTQVLEKRMDEAVYIPGHKGVPGVYCLAHGRQDNKHIRLWPVPDDTYRIRYKFLKEYEDMVNDADESVIPESRRDLLICGALIHAFRLRDQYDKAAIEEVRFSRMLEEHWRREKAVAVVPARLQRFDKRIKVRDPFDISTLGIN